MPSQRAPANKFHSPKVAFLSTFRQVKRSMATAVLESATIPPVLVEDGRDASQLLAVGFGQQGSLDRNGNRKLAPTQLVAESFSARQRTPANIRSCRVYLTNGVSGMVVSRSRRPASGHRT